MVLFVSHSAALYGAERSLLDLIAGLDRTACHPIVALPAEGPLADRLRALGVECWITGHQKWIGGRHVWFARWYRLARNIAAFVRMRRRLRRTPVDLIYTNTSAVPNGGLLARVCGLPHLWHVREYVPSPHTGSRFYYGDAYSFRFIDRTSTRVVCNSRYLKGQLRPFVAPEKLAVVYNGLLPDGPARVAGREQTPSRDDLRLCMVGSLEPNKGHEDALRALRRLHDAGVTARLSIAGTGRNESFLRTLARELDVDAHVEWLGFVDDVAAVYRRAGIVLICSRQEAFGRIAVEAGAWGCPVVASDRGGLPEAVVDGTTGLLYEPGDVEGLSGRILELVDHPDLYRRLSKNAVQSVYERFTMQRYVHDIEREMAAAIREGAP